MASLKFSNVYINDYYTVAGPMEKNGKIKNYNYTIDDYYYGEKTFEKAEVKMQRKVIDNILFRNELNEKDIDLIIGGDLFDQIAITSKALEKYDIPFLGVYSACATFTEDLIIASSMINKNGIKKVLCTTSSHNLTAERQFRYPVEYGKVKYKCNTFTATGAIGAIVSNTESNIKITGATIGKVINMGVKDVNNIGAVMAPAACEVLMNHLEDFKIDATYYDLILTGDLGKTGSLIFKEYLNKKYAIKIDNQMDAGENIYTKNQDVSSGGSGPVCLPLVLFSKILESKKYKHILIIGTGSLHTPTLVNQKNEIAAIAHAVSLEVIK